MHRTWAENRGLFRLHEVVLNYEGILQLSYQDRVSSLNILRPLLNDPPDLPGQ